MTEIRFYHLQRTGEDQVLPQIAYKAWGAGQRVVIKCTDAAAVERLNNALWTFKSDVFLPHGSLEDGKGAQQPIWLTAGNDNPNGAKTLMLMSGCEAPDLGSYDLCCAMLDGNDAAQVEAARAQWKIYKDAGHIVSYWQQSEKGWEKKA